MKKLLSVLLALCMVCALAACGGEKTPAAPAATQAPAAPAATQAPTAAPQPTDPPEPPGVKVSAGGITAYLPEAWQYKLGETSIVTSFIKLEPSGSLNLTTAGGADPKELAGRWNGETFTKTCNGVDFYGVIVENKPEDEDTETTWNTRLYAPFSDKRSLCVFLNLRGGDPAAYKAYMAGEEFTALLSNLRLDPAGYHEPGTASADGFTTNRGVVSAYSGAGGKVEIPAQIGEYDTEVVGRRLFAGNSAITAVVIPEGVTVIDEGAFLGCANLERVTFPETLVEIYNNAFRDCPKLKDVVLPETVSFVGPACFAGSGAGSFTGSAAEFGYNCFADSSFDAIAFPAGADVSADYMFTTAQLREITLPADLTALGQGAFSNCRELHTVVLPDTLTTLGEGCFINMGGLHINLPEGLEEIPDGCFNSTFVDVLRVPASVKRIGDSATFDACYVILSNPEVELGASAINCAYLYIAGAKDFTFPDRQVMWADEVYLDGVYAPLEIGTPSGFFEQYFSDQVFLPMDATIGETEALDAWLLANGGEDIAWVGTAADFIPDSTADFAMKGQRIAGYSGDSDLITVPHYVLTYDDPWWDTTSVEGIADRAFAGATASAAYLRGNYWGGVGSRIFDGCANLKDLWFSTLIYDDVGYVGTEYEIYASDSFAGLPEDVTVHLPASLTDAERAEVQSYLADCGMPASAVYDFYSLR